MYSCLHFIIVPGPHSGDCSTHHSTPTPFSPAKVASLLADSSSVLQDSMESVFHLQELKPLLESQKDVNVLEDGGECSQSR